MIVGLVLFADISLLCHGHFLERDRLPRNPSSTKSAGGCAPLQAIVLQGQKEILKTSQSVAPIRLKVARLSRCLIPQATNR